MKNVRQSAPSLGLIIVLVGFPQISESIFTPVLPQLQHVLRVSANRAQLTMSSYFIAFAIGVLIWGQLADKWGRRPAMLAGIGVYLLGNLGLFLSPDFTWLLGSRLVQAFGASAGSVVTQTIMRESFSGLTGARIFAQTSAAMALAPALGPLIGGIMQTYWGYRSVFGTLIAMAVAVGLYALSRLPETQPIDAQTQSVKQWPLVRRLLSDRIVWGYGLLIGGINGVLFSYYAEAPFIFMTHFGYSAVHYGWLGLILAGASLLGAVLVNWLLNWFTPEQVALGGLIFSVVASGSLVIAAYGQSAGAMLVTIFLTFLGLNVTLPNALNRALVGYEDVMGSASGWFSLGYYLLVSAFTYGMSWLHNGAVETLPWYMLGLCGGMLLSFVGLIVRQVRATSEISE
ncbi:multidrug effflux MFS transporter [Levilactobacillus yiduensis]|uniref:multidrug effflux MFS transporter n=1 Tax=Levilactobacillus yiduensis TaxID=2953880 RepID=UPI000EF2CDF3|nr:multidrug effflux MFS transporter [Levilactobacillus yiduensis]AYM02330.1 Bcr/CflA family efflux MFS transporter [Levilactobacillus brevis]